MEEATMRLSGNGKFILDALTSTWIAVRAIATIDIHPVGQGTNLEQNDRHLIHLNYFTAMMGIRTNRGYFPSYEAAKAFVDQLTGDTSD